MNTHSYAVRPVAAVTTALLCAVVACLAGCSRVAGEPKDAATSTGPAAAAASAPAPTVEKLEAAVAENPLKDAYFGETHVHTSYSLDAYIGGARITPDEAYKFAQGGEVVVNGQKHNIGRPLDWVAVSDHAEFIGEMYSTQVPGAKGGDNPMLEELRGLKTRGRAARLVREVRDQQHARRNPDHPPFYAGPETTRSAWKDVEIKAAIDNYRPGKFTTLAGFEWTSAQNAGNMHRNVIFRDLNVPEVPLSALDTNDEEKLWAWMAEQEKKGSQTAGDSAQLERQQGPDVRAARQCRQADHGGLRAPAQPLRAPDRDDADQGQFGGVSDVLAGRRVRELRERRQRRVVQRPHVQEGELRALGRDQGPRLPDEARRQPVPARLHRRHRQPQRPALGRGRERLHRQPRPGGRHAAGAARRRDRRLDQVEGVEPRLARRRLGDAQYARRGLGRDGCARNVRHLGHAHQGAVLRWRGPRRRIDESA